MNPPVHLQTENLDEDNNFSGSEKIYRRFLTKKTKILGDVFSCIPSKQWITGVSTNRQKYAPDPKDSFWRIFIKSEDESKTCEYELKKNHEVRYLEYDSLRFGNEKLGIQIKCQHRPEKCNKAHCDLYFEPSLETITEEQLVDMRLLIGSLFQPTGITN